MVFEPLSRTGHTPPFPLLTRFDANAKSPVPSQTAGWLKKKHDRIRCSSDVEQVFVLERIEKRRGYRQKGIVLQRKSRRRREERVRRKCPNSFKFPQENNKTPKSRSRGIRDSGPVITRAARCQYKQLDKRVSWWGRF